MAIAAVFTLSAKGAGLSLPNVDFEQDVDADGIPDAWSIAKGAEVSFSSHATNGSRAAKFTDGYVLLQIDQTLDHLAGRKLTLTFDAAGEEGAELGAVLAYFKKKPDGKTTFSYHRLIWGRKLAHAYKPVALSLNFAANAVDGRVWIGIYRSNKTGTVYLDQFASSDKAMSNEKQTDLGRIRREWDYLIQRAQAARPQIENSQEINRIIQRATEIRNRCDRLDAELLEQAATLENERIALEATIYQLQRPGQDFVVGLSQGTLRLDPVESLPVDPPSTLEVLSLENEDQAIGVTIWNCRETSALIRLEIKGLDQAARPIAVRQQVFQENYYDKEKARVADALTKLAKQGTNWQVPVPGGSAVKVYIGFKTTAAMVGANSVKITVRDERGKTRNLDATVQVLPIALPTQPALRHIQFMYPNLDPAASHPEMAAEDLADHHVTAIEFPYIPPAVFHEDGSLAKTNFEGSSQDLWMRAYGPKIERLVLFWQGSMNLKFKTTKDEPLKMLTEEGDWSPQALRAYGELLKAWLDYAAANGFGPEHWASMPADEITSGRQWKSPPGPEVRQMIQLSKVARQVAPKLPIYATFGYHTLPHDAKAVGPWLDVAVGYYPYPTKMAPSPSIPPGFNARETFATMTFPYLEQLRDSRGMQIISYHISRGKKDKVLTDVRSYPVEAVAHGFTGIGFWAYNVTRGSSWNDSDGGKLDYSFIYDGTEDHPLNHKYNITKEVIVPSIRWEALRQGWQDGQILLALKHGRDRSTLDGDLARRIDAAMATAKAFGDSPETLTHESYSRFSRHLRQLYLSMSQPEGATP